MYGIDKSAQVIVEELGLSTKEISSRLAFLEISAEDRALLREFLQQGNLEDMGFVDAFYDFLTTFDEFKPLISNPERLARLKNSQNHYFKTLFEATFDDDYILHRLQVGLTHERIGLDPKWYLGGYSQFIQLVMPIVLDRMDDHEKALKTCSALLKVLFFDINLTLDTYFHEVQRESREKSELLDQAPAIVFMCHPDSLKLEHVNRQLFKYMPALNEDLKGKSLEKILPGFNRDELVVEVEKLKINRDRVIKRRLNLLYGEQPTPCDVTLRMVKISGHTMLTGLIIDVSEQAKREAEVRYQAEHDVLTGLYNRYKLFSGLNELAACKKRTALIFLEIDHFDVINATMGYDVGDNVLVRVGRLLHHFTTGRTRAFWIRGGAFVISYCGWKSRDELKALISEVHLLLDERIEFEGFALSLDVRSGIAISPQSDEWDSDRLVRQAKQALAKAKKEFKSSLFFSDEMEFYHKNHLLMVTELRKAIEEDRLLLYFQPKVDMKQRRVVGVEALVRWSEPGRGMVPPSEFIPVAEQSGVMQMMTEWVMRKALDQLVIWTQKFPDLNLSMSVNLAIADIENDLLMDRIKREVSKRGVDPELLILEVTETGLVHDPDKVIQRLHELNALGTRQSLDDFGAGYSSLSYLRDLPVQELKMDRAFSKGIVQDKKSRAIVQAAIQMAHTLDMNVVAEGIEDQQMWDVLCDLGCDIAQGYYMARPMPADEFEQWVKSSEWGE